MAGRKLVLRPERTESESWTTYKLSPLMCGTYSLSCIRLFATLRTAAHQAPLPTGILQARILERAAMPSSRRSSQPRDQT